MSCCTLAHALLPRTDVLLSGAVLHGEADLLEMVEGETRSDT